MGSIKSTASRCPRSQTNASGHFAITLSKRSRRQRSHSVLALVYPVRRRLTVHRFAGVEEFTTATGKEHKNTRFINRSERFTFDDLDAKSKLRFGAHLGRFLRFADSLYLNFLDGTLDKRLWRGYERTIADTVAYPGFQTWWATRKHWHTDEFCALIDRHIQTAKPKIYDGYN